MSRPEQKLLQELVRTACDYVKSFKTGKTGSVTEYKENISFLKNIDESFLIAAGFLWPIVVKKKIKTLIAA